MTEQEIKDLLVKFKEGRCSAEELALLQAAYNELEHDLPVPETDPDYDLVETLMWAKVTENVPVNQKVKRLRYWSAVAAACTLLIGGTLYLLSANKERSTKVMSVQVEDAPAGSNRATLTLANGQQIALDAAKAGVLAQQAGVAISKNANGQLVYVISDNNAKMGVGMMNTITTPNGGQFEIYLPDGSRVFLNAASSLKFPVQFNGSERLVELRGEGYFEIKQNPNSPFIVSSNGQSVKVLGTHFNVASYTGEPTVTTLAEGRIEISSVSFPQKTILKPGDQSTALSDRFSIKQVNAEDAIAWKDGLFVFNDADLKDVLRQLARWYDVKVDYTAIPDIKFYGEIPRSLSLLKVLQQIEAVSDVSLKLEEGRIMKK